MQSTNQGRICMAKESIKIAQLTDIHLMKTQELLLYDVNTFNAFKQVLNNINKNEYDYIIASGDLSEDGTIESYQYLKETFDQFDIPIYCIPGNHDNRERLIEVLSPSKHVHFDKKLHFLNWEILFLDTKHKNEIHGFINEEELKFLKNALMSSNADNIAIVMHHHPIPVNTPIIDRYSLMNNEIFLDCITAYPQVKLVIFGHVHHDYCLQYGQVTYESSPATCFQFTKGAQEIQLETRIGFKNYLFSADQYTACCQWVNNNVV